MSNPFVPVRRSSILDEYEVFTVLLHLRQQPRIKHVEVHYSSHCFIMGKKWPVHLLWDTAQKTLTFGESRTYCTSSLGFSVLHIYTLCLLTLPLRWKVDLLPKISHLKKSSSSSFHYCMLMQKE